MTTHLRHRKGAVRLVGTLTCVAILSFGVVGGSGGTAAAANWRTEWKQLIKNAKAEGHLTVAQGHSASRYLRPVYKAFEKKYGIRVSLGGGRGRLVTSRLLSERANHVYTVDLVQVGVASINKELLPHDLLAPIPPEFVLPEIKDPSHWYKGHLWWGDPKTKKYVFFYSLPAGDSSIAINTKLVNPADINSYYDVFNHRYDGLRVSGRLGVAEAGESLAAMWMLCGKDWVRRWVESKPIYASDADVMINWLITGRVGIAMFLGGHANQRQISKLGKKGAPIEILKKPMKEGVASNPGSSGNFVLVKNAPHPSAAKLFINWFLSKKGQLVLQKVYPDEDSLRIDIPKDMVNPLTRRKKGVSYRVLPAEPAYHKSLADAFKYMKELQKKTR